MYESRQFLGMTMLLSGYRYDNYLYIPLSLIFKFMFLEILPFFYMLDLSFLNRVQ